MQALILAGGKGTRLQPYTTVLPKPLMPVGEYPILEIILRQLKKAGFDEVILAIGYMGQLFESFFGDGERFGLKISYSFEEEALGTAGPIGLVWDQLQDDFLVMNGDLLTTMHYGQIFKSHLAHKHPATVGLYTRDVHIDFGVIDTDEEGCIDVYTEKPTLHYDVSMGINVFSKAGIQQYIQPGKVLGVPDLVRLITGGGEKVQTYREDCMWLDIGRVDDYTKAAEIFEQNRSAFLID